MIPTPPPQSEAARWVDYTPLAVAVESAHSADIRALALATLKAEGWDHARLLEQLEARVKELLGAQDAAGLEGLLRTLQDASRTHGGTEQAKGVVESLRVAFLEWVDLLLDWHERPGRHRLAVWMSKVAGPQLLDPLFRRLPRAEAAQRRAMDGLIRAVEPGPHALYDLVRFRPPEVVGALTALAGNWPDPAVQAWVGLALASSSTPHRLAALQSLEERVAFRFVAQVRARLHDANASVRIEAARWMARLEHEPALADFRTLLARPATAPAERKELYLAASRLGERGLALLLERLAREDTAGQLELVQILGGMSVPGATAALREGAQSTTLPRTVRQACADELKKGVREG